VNQPTTRWRTDDPCPVCGAGLIATDDDDATIRQDCPLCGWSAIWQADLDGEAA
jgi:ribosomal protein S27AE